MSGISLPTTFCWALAASGRRPPLALALRFGEDLRAAVMRTGNRLGLARLPDAFHGGDAPGAHDHAWWLSEDRDGDGAIDHVTVHARSGLSPEIVAALAGTRTVWVERSGAAALVPVSLGRPRTGGLLGPARRWRAATAYVTPKHRTDPSGARDPRLTPEAQLREEIARRGLPAPVSVAWAAAGADGFAVTAHGRRAPYDAWRGLPELAFAEAVPGPLAFGFGAHFGLGLLVPAVAAAQARERHPGVLARRGK